MQIAFQQQQRIIQVSGHVCEQMLPSCRRWITKQQKVHWYYPRTKTSTFYKGFFSDKPHFFYYQDSASYHISWICKQWFTRNYTKVLRWSENSCDLNRIEYLWFPLKKLVHLRRTSNKKELLEAIIVSWDELMFGATECTFGMSRRLGVVLKNTEYPTKYW